MKDKPAAAVIGGYGGMGRLFAKLLSDEGFDVMISGPTRSRGEKAAAELGVTYVAENTEAVKGADVTIVSVPIEATVEVINEVGPRLEKGSLIMDLTSIKEEPCKAMRESVKEGVEVLGAHPIFGPRVGSVAGQVIVLTPVRGGRWSEKIREIFVKNKARIVESTPEEHDRVMAVVQGLTHFAYISIGKTLKDLGFDIRESRNYSSPIYELMLDIVGRIIGQDPDLYAEIQMRNRWVKPVREAFMNASKEIMDAVEKKDAKAFTEIMVSSARHFDDVDSAMGRSDKAISSLIAELDSLKKSVGKEILVQHIYSGVKHVGLVEEVSPDEVVLSEGGRKRTLKLSNLRVLDDAEKKAYKSEKYGVSLRDYSYVLNSSADENFIAGLLVGFDENIAEVNVKDVYTGPQLPEGSKSVCFGVSIINSGLKDSEKAIASFFERIGGKPR